MASNQSAVATSGVPAAAKSPWLRNLARVGYAAIGLVYLLIGLLGGRMALGLKGDSPDKENALRQLLVAPFGRIILAVMAMGLIGFFIWRLFEAALDLYDVGTGPKGLVIRIGYVISGLIYGSLAIEAGLLALRLGGGGSGEESTRDWTARLLAQPYGPWLVGGVGLIVIGTGLYQLVRAWRKTYRSKLALNRMSPSEQRLADGAAQIGLVAHGLVLTVIGSFFVKAANSFDANESGGIARALIELAQRPYGPWLLLAVALGLGAYGIFNLFNARYQVLLAR